MILTAVPAKKASDAKSCSHADMRNSLCQLGSVSVPSFASSLDHSQSSPVSTELHCIAHCFCIALHWFALASLSLLSRQHQLHCIAHCIASRCIALGSPSFLSSQHWVALHTTLILHCIALHWITVKYSQNACSAVSIGHFPLQCGLKAHLYVVAV